MLLQWARQTFTALAAPKKGLQQQPDLHKTIHPGKAGPTPPALAKRCRVKTHLQLFSRTDTVDWWKMPHEGHGRLPWQCHRDAILACGKAYVSWGEVNYPLAAQYLKGIDAGHTVKYMGGRPLDLVKRVFSVFYQQGRIGEHDRSGKEPIWEVADAKRIAAILKGGKMGHMFRGGQRVERLVYYTSMDQAIREDHELQQLQRKYDATAAQMLAAAKYHDPDLQRRTITYHPDFSADQLAKRIKVSTEQLEHMPAHPLLRRLYLDHYMWADEGSILLSDMNLARLKVWASAANFNLQDIVSLPQMQGEKDCKVHFIVFLSSHPAFKKRGGVVYWEFTTGTDNIRRMHNTLDQTDHEPFGYMTKAGRDAASTVFDETCDNVVLAIRAYRRATGDMPILVMDNIKIQAMVPDDWIHSRYGTEWLAPGHRVRIPTYSPDFNQVAEHTIGFIKRHVKEYLYGLNSKMGPHTLQQAVKTAVSEIKHESIVKNVLKMPTVWGIISTAHGAVYTDYDGIQHPGSGGWWPQSTWT